MSQRVDSTVARESRVEGFTGSLVLFADTGLHQQRESGFAMAMLVMIVTPVVAKRIGLNNPRSALIFGGLMGTTSGVAGGLAATDEKLVPYGAMTATFYIGLGCLLGPSVVFMVLRAILGT